jgi:hypothetical protein
LRFRLQVKIRQRTVNGIAGIEGDRARKHAVCRSKSAPSLQIIGVLNVENLS